MCISELNEFSVLFLWFSGNRKAQRFGKRPATRKDFGWPVVTWYSLLFSKMVSMMVVVQSSDGDGHSTG